MTSKTKNILMIRKILDLQSMKSQWLTLCEEENVLTESLRVVKDNKAVLAGATPRSSSITKRCIY